jgi:hypothetical protein
LRVKKLFLQALKHLRSPAITVLTERLALHASFCVFLAGEQKIHLITPPKNLFFLKEFIKQKNGFGV